MQDQESFSYEDRYGISPRPRWYLPAALCAVLGISWVIWAGIHHSIPEIRSAVISFKQVGDSSMSLRYSITRRDENAVVICTLIARDFDKNIVGEIDDRFEPGEKTIERETLIPARNTPVNADISRCRIA